MTALAGGWPVQQASGPARTGGHPLRAETEPTAAQLAPGRGQPAHILARPSPAANDIMHCAHCQPGLATFGTRWRSRKAEILEPIRGRPSVELGQRLLPPTWPPGNHCLLRQALGRPSSDGPNRACE